MDQYYCDMYPEKNKIIRISIISFLVYIIRANNLIPRYGMTFVTSKQLLLFYQAPDYLFCVHCRRIQLIVYALSTEANNVQLLITAFYCL